MSRDLMCEHGMWLHENCKDCRIAELESEIDEIHHTGGTSYVRLENANRRIAELDQENAELKAEWMKALRKNKELEAQVNKTCRWVCEQPNIEPKEYQPDCAFTYVIGGADEYCRFCGGKVVSDDDTA